MFARVVGAEPCRASVHGEGPAERVAFDAPPRSSRSEACPAKPVHAEGRAWRSRPEAPRPLDIAKVARVFHLASKRAGLPHFRLYDLRHTYASLLLAGGAPITYVSAQLGHANPATTLRYYAKWIPSQGQRWVDLLERGRVAEALTAEVGTTLEPKAEFRTVDDPQLLGRIGSPGRTRTCDLVINSHPLYRLSYRGIPGGRTALYRTRARPDGPTSLS